MKKYLLPLVSFLIIATSCEVTVGGDKPGSNEDSEIKNGFSYEEFTVSINGIESIKNNEIIRGENIIIEFDGVSNATLKDGFQHVGISLKVSDANGVVLSEHEDLLSKIEQQDPKIDFLEAYFSVPSDAQEESLIMEVTLFDKYGTVSYDFKETYKLVSKPAIATKGIKLNSNLDDVNLSSQLFVGKRQFEKAPAKINKGEELLIYVNGVKNFTEENGAVDMDYVMKIMDDNNKEVYLLEDELSGPVEGFDTYPLYFSKVFSEFESGNYTWDLLVSDQKSDKFVSVSAAITVK